jgi:hypothetical protein
MKSYVGCDYWPTVLANPAWSVFDFAVVVANAGDEAADVDVTGPDGAHETASVAPNAIAKVYLPWVSQLKGGEADSCGNTPSAVGTAIVPKGAYHLVATRPVTVYQFNALEYKGSGGPPGKSWSACPGNTPCSTTGKAIGCFSFSNDASLLLPSTAMTGNYRFTGAPGTSFSILGVTAVEVGGYVGITAVEDGTHVTVSLSSIAHTVGGGGVPAGSAGQNIQFVLGAGDVAQIITDTNAKSNDLSGSLVQADKPIQVLTGVQCANYPATSSACDHVEESVLPAETLGKHYVVTVPTAPSGAAVGHIVRLYGNQDGTTLTYAPSKPAGCPDTLAAGQVAPCGANDAIVKTSFEVSGDKEFGVVSLMLGASIQDPGVEPDQQRGDPSVSQMVAVEQWRAKYVFLAPDDYDTSYADIAAPPDAHLTLDGQPVGATIAPISNAFGVYRVKLDSGEKGAHVLQADKPVGIQVMGFGAYTSYQYPGGMNLDAIAPPPPPPPPPK